jgi:hypothetical protein
LWIGRTSSASQDASMAGLRVSVTIGFMPRASSSQNDLAATAPQAIGGAIMEVSRHAR